MMKVNERQVGGTHWKTQREHWDWWTEDVTESPMYLAGCATKYITRWRKKNGKEDLEKAGHYMAKMLEMSTYINWPELVLLPEDAATLNAKTLAYAKANDLEPWEANAVLYLASWALAPKQLSLLRGADALVRTALEQLDAANAPARELPPAKPVPVEDSNRHALQNEED